MSEIERGLAGDQQVQRRKFRKHSKTRAHSARLTTVIYKSSSASEETTTVRDTTTADEDDGEKSQEEKSHVSDAASEKLENDVSDIRNNNFNLIESPNSSDIQAHVSDSKSTIASVDKEVQAHGFTDDETPANIKRIPRKNAKIARTSASATSVTTANTTVTAAAAAVAAAAQGNVAGPGRSIEIFFGDFTNFGNFYQVLSDEDPVPVDILSSVANNNLPHPPPSATSTSSKKRASTAAPGSARHHHEDKFSKTSTVNPLLVKKLCLIGHPLESFQGINNFKRLLEAWVTNCTIKELKKQDLQGLQHLQRLYAFGCSLEKVDPLHLDNLKILWLSGNRLTSLSFLNHGLPMLQELNVANNEISCLSAESLFRCPSLENLNVAGNPLCTIQDISEANACPKLKELTLMDAMYGKCPVACLCDSRPMIISAIKNINVLNGKKITEEEVQVTQEYLRHRCLYYYSNSVGAKCNHVALRNATIASVYKQLEGIGERIMDLLAFQAQTDYQLSTTPAFAKNKPQVKDEMQKVHKRIVDLRMWAVVTIERFETVIHINRWEQEIEEWLKWIEYQSYGSIQGYVAHSVLDLAASKDVENIRSTIHQLISGLSCSKPWPEDVLLKVESIAVIRDKGAELGMEKTFGAYFSRLNEPKFIPPPPESPPPDPPTPASIQAQVYTPYKVVPTYTDPDYKPPEPLFPFPESVPGLPERSHPCFLFLMCDEAVETNPVLYLYKLLTDKSENFMHIRFTNCLWNAIEVSKNPTDKRAASRAGTAGTNKDDASSANSARPMSSTPYRSKGHEMNQFSVVVVMKVLEECLVTVPSSCDKCKKHSPDCLMFGVSKPLSYAPAYVVSISHSHNDPNAIWVKGVHNDAEVKAGVENLYREALAKQAALGFNTPPAPKSQTTRVLPYYLHKSGHGMKADLTAISKLVQNPVPFGDTMEIKEYVEHQLKMLTKMKASVDLLRISKFLGPEIAHTVTTLDLSGNGLGLTVGLEGMNNLRRLNLSHNNLTTLSGLHKLPHLIELKASWNYLRFLHSSISTLTWATPRLTTLEILPNPFQDVRDYAHIPLLVSQALPSLHRVDIWSAPFSTSPKLSHNCFLSASKKVDIESGFSQAILAGSWVQGRSLTYREFKGKCLTNLDQLPRSPPFPEGYSINAIELDLSDNYLSSTALGVANFVRTSEWRAAVVKLNLQENCITSLDWLKDNIFPNLHILNLSNNHLQELDMIQYACPALVHLHLSGNPLPCSTFILAPLRHLTNLQNLEASRTPLSSHPDYANYVIRYIPKIQILDGTPVANWRSEEIVNHMGGTLNTEWLEMNLGQRDWSSLTELSLPHCGLSRVNLPSSAVPKLMSLDLTGNQLSTFSGITSLPNLRVLCVSYNSIKSLGPIPCPTCYSHTAESRAQFQKNKNLGGITFSSLSSIASSISSGGKLDTKSKINGPVRKTLGGAKSDLTKGSSSYRDLPYNSPRGSSMMSPEPPKIFPRLEVLIMSHNSLSGVSDLHLHCLPRLQTLMLNCNQITSFKGLDKLTSVQAIVLDHNQIKDIPFNTFVGCKCLKYLHMEHNRISCLPRLPHLNNLAALHLGYNRIQSLTDLNCLTLNGIKELTLTGNPASYRSDYCKQVVSQVGTLQKLDGTDVSNHITLKGDLPALKFTVSESPTTHKSKKQKSSVMPVPHGKLRYRVISEVNPDDDEEALDQFTDVASAE